VDPSAAKRLRHSSLICNKWHERQQLDASRGFIHRRHARDVCAVPQLVCTRAHTATLEDPHELASEAEAEAAAENEAGPVASATIAPSINRNKGDARKQCLSEKSGGG
jgi:hypothetical protein